MSFVELGMLRGLCLDVGKNCVGVVDVDCRLEDGFKRRWPCPGLEGNDDGLALA